MTTPNFEEDESFDTADPTLTLMSYRINTSPAPAAALHTFQQVRLDMVQELVKGGMEGIDIKSAALLNTILSSGETAAAATLRLGIEEQGMNHQAAFVSGITTLLDKIQSGDDPFALSPELAAKRLAAQENAELPTIDLVPGQTLIGVDSINPDDFSAIRDK